MKNQKISFKNFELQLNTNNSKYIEKIIENLKVDNYKNDKNIELFNELLNNILSLNKKIEKKKINYKETSEDPNEILIKKNPNNFNYKYNKKRKIN